MASFNKVLLMGNLTRDPQLKYLPSSNTAVAEFGLACNRKYRTAQGEDREEVTFVDLTAFGKQAEVLNQYMTKGKPLFVEGRLKLDQWEDKNGGGKRSKLTVVIENFQFVGGRDSGSGEGSGGGGGGAQRSYDDNGADHRTPQRGAPQRQQSGRPAPAPTARQQPEQPFGEEQTFKEDDIPF
jgi:single-strand DNA-binding protein